MKRKFSRILRVGVTLFMVLSLSLAFAPAALAGSVSEPDITLDDYSISATAEYIIKFDTYFALNMADNDTITVRFPSGTTVPTTYVLNSIAVSKDGGTNYTDVATGNATLDDITREAVIRVPLNIPVITHVAVKFKATCLIVNPNIPGDYTLEVKTTEESTYKVSEIYTIGVPGMVTRYNKDGNFVGSYNNIQLALDAANSEDVLKVGPGTYKQDLNTADTYLTIESTGTAAETVIKGAVTIDSASTTIDGLTLKGEVAVIGNSCTIKNSTLSKYSTSGETLLTISGNTTKITDCIFDTTYKSVQDTAVLITGGDTITIDGCSFTTDEGSTSAQDLAIDVAATTTSVVTSLTVKNSTFSGTKGTGYRDASANKTTVTVKDNSFDGFERAFLIDNSATGSSLTVRVNTITNSTKKTLGAIEIDGATSVVIVGNTIKDNAGYSVLVDANQDKVKVIGNNLLDNVKGLKSSVTAATADHLKAENNWWGDASGPAGEGTGSGDKVSTYVDYKPYLATSISSGQTALAATSLDAKTVASVYVSDLDTAADLIWAAKYEANPQDVEPEYSPLADAWFDVYIGTGPTSAALIKLYADDIDSNTDAYAWSALKNKWMKCDDQGASSSGGYVWVKVSATEFPSLDDMAELPFVLVDAPAAAKAKFNLTAPEAGATVPILTNVPFTWASVAEATSYDLVISASPDLSAPIAEESIAGTAYIYAATLTDGTPYYWQVTAMEGDTVEAKSDVSTFIAKLPAEAVTPQVTVQPPVVTVTPPAVTVEAPQITVTPPDITVESPTITVEAAPAPAVTVEAPPAAAPAVPSYMLWMIIAIGAVLVIALIVLIVRTRRVA